MIEDTMLKHHVVISEKGVPHDLAFIGSIYTDVPYYKDDAKGEDNFALLPVERMRTYNCRDTLVTHVSDSGLTSDVIDLDVSEAYQHDMAMIRPLLRMMKRGVWVNPTTLATVKHKLQAELDEFATDLRAILGDGFNIQSDKQLREFLFTELGFTPVAWTKGRQPAVDFDSLMQIAEQADPVLEPLFTLLLEHRRVSKLLSTYIKDFILDDDGRLHTQFTLHVTPSGRLSSRRPNLQNFPDGMAKDIIEATPGFEFLEVDKAQIELRILAYLVDDEAWIRAFELNEDVHLYTTADLFSIKPHEVVKWQRDFAKTFTYGAILYGGTAKTVRRQALSRALRERDKSTPIPLLADIEKCQQAFFKKHPGIQRFQQKIANTIRSTGQLRSSSPTRRLRIFLRTGEAAVRAGYNHPIQEFAAYVIGNEMIQLNNILLEPEGMDLQVHDSLLLELREETFEERATMVKKVMEQPYQIGSHRVVLPTTAKRGRTWGSLMKIA